MISTLNHPVHKIIQKLLIELGLGTTPTDNQPWPVSAPKEPTSPDDCIVVNTTTGVEVGYRAQDGIVQYHKGFQVMVRCSDDTLGYRKAEFIKAALNESVDHHVIILDSNSYCVDICTSSGDIINMGMRRSETRLQLWSINFTTDLKQLS